MSVSYTHLDVYKRQPSCRLYPGGNGADAGPVYEGVHEAGAQAAGTVSYTHLDVYKRQQQGFTGLGRKQTEWKAWMDREKDMLTEIAQQHEFCLLYTSRCV